MSGTSRKAKEKILSNASNSATKENFARLSANYSYNRWIKKNNRYINDTIKTIERDIKKSRYRHKHLNEYIAATIVTHCMDAWSYFGRAINSLINGDIRIARHLFYYSELRSAMSILASQGIGAFNRDHFVVTSNDRCKLINGTGTHTFVWEAIDYWINRLNAHSTLSQIIRPDNIELNLWLNNFLVSAGMKETLLKSFLRSIGFDLQIFINDRDARNDASYRPASMVESTFYDYQKVLNEIISCWELCEPIAKPGLQRIDAILLKRLFHVSFKETHSHRKSHKQAFNQFTDKINNMFKQLGLPDSRARWWKNYFNNDDLTDRIFSYIDNNIDKDKNDYIFGMKFRALFLLRISSALCEDYILDNHTLTKEDLEFWWCNIGLKTGLWDDSIRVNQFSDLWEDISVEINELSLWINNTNKEVSQYRFQQDKNVSSARLSSFERVCLWSLGI